MANVRDVLSIVVKVMWSEIWLLLQPEGGVNDTWSKLRIWPAIAIQHARAKPRAKSILRERTGKSLNVDLYDWLDARIIGR